MLLVGGASTRFGSPKALARFGNETLAERGWRLLGEAFDARIAVGKGDSPSPIGERDMPPFDIVVEPAEPTAPIAGVVAGLRAAGGTCVFLPVDCPLVRPETLRALGEAVAVVQTGPLPGAYAQEHLAELERRIATGELTLRGVNHRVLEVDARELANVNTRAELSALEQHLAALDDHGA